jgi:Flp pilus assembly protein TadG
MGKKSRLFTRLRHGQANLDSQDGATIIEFAVVAPIIILTVIGFIEVALMFFTNAVLEGAANVASRSGKTGYSPESVERERFIREEIQRLSGGFLAQELLSIRILSYQDFSVVGQPEPCANRNDSPPCRNGFVDVNGNGRWDADQGRNGVGKRNDAVLYTITYNWQVITPLMRAVLSGNGGSYQISAVTAVKNEPF